jgi:hypothetical protein
MPVYHISNFDVSAVQIDLSANVFSAISLEADYWVDASINFDSYIGFNTALNTRFRTFVTDNNVGIEAIVRKSATRSTNPGTTIVTDVFLKDLGVINKNDNSLYSSDIYSNITTLRGVSGTAGSFLNKVNTLLVAKTPITNLRERMMASINASTGSDLGLDGTTPINSKFGFLIVRNLNLAGTSQDQTIHIACILTQDPAY